MLNKIDFANEKENIQRKKIKQLTLHSDYIAIFSNEKYDRADGRLINYFNGKRYEVESKWYGDEKNKRNIIKKPVNEPINNFFFLYLKYPGSPFIFLFFTSLSSNQKISLIICVVQFCCQTPLFSLQRRIHSFRCRELRL